MTWDLLGMIQLKNNSNVAQKKRPGEIQLKNAFQQACECSMVTDEEAEGAQCLRFFLILKKYC